MKCKKVKRKLSAYLDRELESKKKRTISEHLERCPDCRKELVILSQQDEFLEQLETIKPSPDFHTAFWQKVATAEQAGIKREATKIPRLSWLPVPAMSFLIILIIFYLFTFSSLLFAKDQDLRNQIVSYAVKNFIIPPYSLNPVSLLNFCKGCYETLCKCAQNQGVSSKCVCGKCKVDKNEGGNKN